MENSSGILQTFWGLSSLEEDDQLQSAKQLITSLQESQVIEHSDFCPSYLSLYVIAEKPAVKC